jgi:hypothetical protein
VAPPRLTPGQAARLFSASAAARPSPRRPAEAPDLARLLRLYGLPAPVPQYRFARPRRWAFDWAYPDRKVAMEFEGGIWSKGRHVRGRGYENDCRKYNEAAIMGWCVIRVTRRMVESGEWLLSVLAALAGRRQM